MTTVRLVVLGNLFAGDDGAALLAAREVCGDVELVEAGRPGPGLLDLLAGAAPVVLVDVTRSGAAAGTLFKLPFDQLRRAAVAGSPMSSHGFGPAEALRLGQALGRAMPAGYFVGVEGARFDPGAELSGQVRTALPALAMAIGECAASLGAACSDA